ncbi:hypothetical protein ABT297_15345 [Dactylosporangium sp. NPDC000555]|uniref:hypothetical protein n=1 Tax=Dactylosporangium sp. NPDC000555 TaxID=3154260 RepID=UPI00331958BB
MSNARPTARAGLVLAALLAFAAACGDDPSPAAAPTTAAAAPQTSAPAAGPGSDAPSTPAATGSPVPSPPQAVNKDLVYTIAKRRANPPAGRVEVARGDVVRITVTSDEADQLHVHGYNTELALAAGQPGSITLTADRTGLFEVETHKSHLVLFQLVVR